MSADYRRIYAEHAREYDALIRAEDVDGSLLTALNELCALDGATVVDVGAGTGRISRLVHGRAGRVIAIDQSAAMIAVAREALAGAANVAFHVADAARLPVDDGVADLCVAAWCFGHTRSWSPATWREEIGGFLAEMRRVTRPGGVMVVIETLGTGSESPAAPTDALAEYYAWLEAAQGFSRRALRTDYEFESADAAARVTGFFFGEAFAARVRTNGWRRVPECTGVWASANGAAITG